MIYHVSRPDDERTQATRKPTFSTRVRERRTGQPGPGALVKMVGIGIKIRKFSNPKKLIIILLYIKR